MAFDTEPPCTAVQVGHCTQGPARGKSSHIPLSKTAVLIGRGIFSLHSIAFWPSHVPFLARALLSNSIMASGTSLQAPSVHQLRLKTHRKKELRPPFLPHPGLLLAQNLFSSSFIRFIPNHLPDRKAKKHQLPLHSSFPTGSATL